MAKKPQPSLPCPHCGNPLLDGVRPGVGKIVPTQVAAIKRRNRALGQQR